MPVSQYERALVRLKAFELLAEWGTTDADKKFKSWDLETRTGYAFKLADQALNDPDTPK